MNRANPPRRGATLVDMLLRFLVQRVLVAARAILLPLDALRMQALVLVGEVVAVFAVVAGENDFLSRHSFLFQLECGLRIADCRMSFIRSPQSAIPVYLMIF